MSRVLFLSMSEAAVRDHCATQKVGISASEKLPDGGTRLVCMSVDGAERTRKSLKSKLMKTEPERARTRPPRPSYAR